MANTKPQVKVVNVATGEEIVRDATVEEIAQMELNKQNTIVEKANIAAKQAERQAILDRLGLTTSEAKLILG